MSVDMSGARPGTRRQRDGLLIGLAVAAGVADAICLTALGVFTAAVTANVVLVGIALGDGDPHTALRAAVAFTGFGVGVFIGAHVLGTDTPGGSQPSRTPPVLAGVGVLQLAFFAGWLAGDGRPDGIALDLLAVASATAMGAQTASARAWHPGITTTYVSGTLTDVLSRIAGSHRASPRRLRELTFIAAIAAGATVGALLLTHTRELVALVPVLLTALVTAVTMRLLRRRPGGDGGA